MSIGRTAERFGQRPSLLVGLAEPLLALQLDEAIALRLTKADLEARRAMSDQRRPAASRGDGSRPVSTTSPSTARSPPSSRRGRPCTDGSFLAERSGIAGRG
jgi:hypothetical protein